MNSLDFISRNGVSRLMAAYPERPTMLKVHSMPVFVDNQHKEMIFYDPMTPYFIAARIEAGQRFVMRAVSSLLLSSYEKPDSLILRPAIE